MQIKEGSKYKIKWVSGKLLTARVTHINVRGRGHSVTFEVHGKGQHSVSATEFKKMAVELM